MNTNRIYLIFACLALGLLTVRSQEPDLARCTFESEGENEYFPLRPGLTLTLEGEEEDEDGELEQLKLIWKVTDATKEITLMLNGEPITIETRVLEETETIDGELSEISRNFYAHCEETDDVYYFGEEVDIYDDGEIIAHDGAWLAGVDGAMPGIIMPGDFVVGATYAQEVAPGIAEDLAENTDEGIDQEVPAGVFADSVEVTETDALEPDADPSEKIYAPGLGLIVDDVLELTSFTLGTSGSLEDCTFASEGENPYFPLRPGLTLTLEGEEENDDGEIDELKVVLEVTRDTREITLNIEGEMTAIETRVVRETETNNDDLTEISLNYYAHCEETDTVYYFGEDVDIYEDGEVIGHDGAWLAGIDGALPGVIMPGLFVVGDAYAQEVAPGIAEDEAVNVEADVSQDVPFASFDSAILIEETNALEPDADPSEKVYAPGVGLIMDDVLELTEVDLANDSFQSVGISELHYHPAIPSEDEEEAGYDDEDFFEFMELTNYGNEPVDMSGASFTQGVSVEFEEGAIIAPGESKIVVRNAEAMALRYGSSISEKIMGVFEEPTGLKNRGGETLILADAEEIPVVIFTYADSEPWLEAADGDGPSLVSAGTFAGSNFNDPESWQLSRAMGGSPGAADDGAYAFAACTFASIGENPYFPLRAGLRLVLEGEEDGDRVNVVIDVLNETRVIAFEGRSIETRIVRKTETINGVLAEISRNYYAHCVENGDVYYFGEEVDIYKDGAIVSNDGAWLAGVDGAVPGIIMPGLFAIGDSYAQEAAPGIAEDRAAHVEDDVDTEVPAGEFEGTVLVEETNPLEPDAEPSEKVYAPGIGLIVDDFIKLIEFDLSWETAACTFESEGDNPYFPLRPGLTLELEGEDEGELVRLVVEVLDETKDITVLINGEETEVETRVLRETETVDGQLVEISLNYYAHCVQTGSVHYFGEDVDIYEDGVVVSHDGAWLAGVDGALSGVIMPGTFVVGDAYAQETAPGIAEDMAENAETGEETVTPWKTFQDTVIVEETNALEPDAEPSEKAYAPGVGLIIDDFLELVYVDLALSLADCHFSSISENPYFPLRPGLTLTFEGEEDGESLQLEIEVLEDTKEITFEADGEEITVECRIIQETESADDEHVEISQNFFAHCLETGDVYYFGEDVDIYEDGEVVSHEGAWIAGVDDAQPGVIMKGVFRVGDSYEQEVAPGIAEDRAVNTASGVSVTVPARSFTDAVTTSETTPLEPDADPSTKTYARDIGLIQDGPLELVEVDLALDYVEYDLSSVGENRYFPLRPGLRLELEGSDEDGLTNVVWEVLEETREITFEIAEEEISVNARVLKESESLDGELIEVGQFYFAHCEENGAVYFFGEDIEIYEDGEVVSNEGSWLAGVDGSRPGIIMPGFPDAGEVHTLLYAPIVDDAEQGEVIDVRATVETPATTFEDAVIVEDGSPYEPNANPSEKAYAAGVGLVMDDYLQLINFDLALDRAACTFSSTGNNPYFPLRPGIRLAFEGEEDGAIEKLVFEVTTETRLIDGIETRVIRETHTVDDELTEVSLNFFAHCEETGSVHYFGEEVDLYENGVVIGNEGAWLAGVDGARAGIIMPGYFYVGDSYPQEVAHGIAEDRAVNVEQGESIDVPAGTFEDTIAIEETTPLEPDADPSEKIYALGIGLVVDDILQLVEFNLGVPMLEGVGITEINYNPAPLTDDETEEGYDDADDFEFVEFRNFGEEPVNLAGALFTRGFDFEFPEGPESIIAPGAVFLLVRDAEAFEYRYGEELAALIVGEFQNDTGLSNRGEGIELSDASRMAVFEVEYDDAEPWPTSADGEGPTLVWAGSNDDPDFEDPANWRMSQVRGGSPGVFAPQAEPTLDAKIMALEFMENGDVAVTAENNGGQVLELVASHDLIEWTILGEVPIGETTITDEDAEGATERFYQIRIRDVDDEL